MCSFGLIIHKYGTRRRTPCETALCSATGTGAVLFAVRTCVVSGDLCAGCHGERTSVLYPTRRHTVALVLHCLTVIE